MPFGKHRGKQLSELPAGYLAWLLTLPDLNAWLRQALEQEAVRRGMGEYVDESDRGSAIALVDLRGLIKRWFSELSLRWHPDRGGSHQAMAALNAAHDRLREMLGI
jgi:hypothetical protein